MHSPKPLYTIEYKEYKDLGEYYACVKDRAGNVSEDGVPIIIHYVDTNVLECDINFIGKMGDNDWYTSDVKIEFSNDEGDTEDPAAGISGIRELHIYVNGKEIDDESYDLDYDTDWIEVSIVASDKAGNSCSENGRLRRDTKDPVCTDSGDKTRWTTGSHTIYYGCRDNMSGCRSGSGGHITYNTNTKTATIPGYTITDEAGNSRTCDEREANVYLDDCKDTREVRASTGSCSKKCDSGSGPGSRSYTNNYVGTFSDSYICRTKSGTEDCNKMSCCSSTTDISGTEVRTKTGTCNKTCGGGTRTDTYKINTRSSYDSSISCGTREYSKSGVKCNTQACPSSSGGSSSSGGDSGSSGSCEYGYGCCGYDSSNPGWCKCNCAPTGFKLDTCCH